jgi:ABC-2 type transport system permease protein
MKILDLAFKDLSQMLRDKRSLLFVVAMPILFTIFMGFAYRGGSNQANTDPRIPLAVVNPQPDARLNQALMESLEASDAIRPVPQDENTAMDALHKGDVAGVLVIPLGFDEQANSGLIPQLKLIASASSADGQSLYQLLRTPVSRLFSTVAIARISADEQANPGEYVPAFDLARSKWAANSQLSLVSIEQAVVQKSSDWTGGNPYNQASPGILVQFAVFGLITSAQILVQERKSRTLERMMTTAMHPREIVGGHLLAMFTLTFFQTTLLVIFGQYVLKVDYMREGLGTLLVAVTLCLWVATVGLLIGVVAREEQQVILYSMIAMFFFSALGGTWFPLEMAGGAFAAIGKLLPTAWAMNGFQNLLIRGLGLDSTLLPSAVLLGYAFLFFVVAVWRFGKVKA